MVRVALVAALLLALAAAALAQPPLNDRQRILHFLNRAGYGARPGEVEEVERRGLFLYLQQQLAPETIDDSALEARLRSLKCLAVPALQMVKRYPDPLLLKKIRKENPQAEVTWFGDANTLLAEMQQQRLLRAIYSRRQLQEVVVDFWMNHFNVYFAKGPNKWASLPYERDVVRPHALGRFRDLLGAVAHSPAMMVYLDNYVSRVEVVPKKPGAKKIGGVNENYARELLELHTMGVDGGYTQKDVVEIARCFTGWTITREYAFVFRPEWHDNGEKIVLGQRIAANGGQSDGERVLDILAAHPSTARFLAQKLCRELICDDPPPAVVDQVARTFTRSGGDLRRTLATIFNSAAFWSREAWRAKVKTPYRLVVSAIRAVDGELENVKGVVANLRQLGMSLYLCDPPTGYVDRADHWISAGSLLDRLNMCVALVRNQVAGVRVDLARLTTGAAARADALNVLLEQTGLYGEISSQTLESLRSGKPDYAQLAGLIMGSPEFQRR